MDPHPRVSDEGGAAAGQRTTGQSITYFDQDGETRLLLGPDGDERTFVVSWKAMSLVCSAWKSMLNPHSRFKEGTLGDDRVIPLPDDHPGALKILLNIAHFHFEKVPSTLSFHSILHLAVLTEKYGATKLVRPWVEGWLKRAEVWVNKPGYEELLYVAWAFGRADIFVDIASHLVKNASVNRDGQCVAPGGRVLDPMSEAVHFPPGILESILQRRLEMISSQVQRIYLRLDDYLKTNMGSVASRPCCRYTARAHSDDVANCNALCFGSLILELQKIGLGPERKKAADIDKSVCSLTDSIRNMKVRSLPDKRDPYATFMEDHSACSSHDFVSDPQAYALANVSPVLDAHQVHMIVKRKELYDLATERQIQARFSAKGIKTVFSVHSNPIPVNPIFDSFSDSD